MAKHPAPPTDSPTEAGPYRRWSRRKAQHRRRAAEHPSEPAATMPETLTGEPAIAQAELPSLDTLDEHSKLGAFFAEGVSESLRRSALRKIFHLQKYNVCDGLDDYAEDYTHFQPLGDIMTADLRLRLEREELKRALGNGRENERENERLAGKPVDPAADRDVTGPRDTGEALASPSDGAEPAAKT